MGESFADNVTDELPDVGASIVDFLRERMAPLYDAVDRLCDDAGQDRPPRF